MPNYSMNCTKLQKKYGKSTRCTNFQGLNYMAEAATYYPWTHIYHGLHRMPFLVIPFRLGK